MKEIVLVFLIIISIILSITTFHYGQKAALLEKRAREQSKMTDQAIEVAKECQNTLVGCKDALQSCINGGEQVE